MRQQKVQMSHFCEDLDMVQAQLVQQVPSLLQKRMSDVVWMPIEARHRTWPPTRLNTSSHLHVCARASECEGQEVELGHALRNVSVFKTAFA